MTEVLKVKAIVQAGQTLLLDGVYREEDDVVELIQKDFARKEKAGVVKRAVFIGTDLADLQAAIDTSAAAAKEAASVAAQLPEQVAAGLSQGIGALQLAASLDESLPQTSATDATRQANTEQTGNQGSEAVAEAAANGTGAADGSVTDAAAAGSAPAADVAAGEQAKADAAATATTATPSETTATPAAPATKTKGAKAKA
jgi:hypothetical protein